jgi:hypothetical protein
MLSGTMSRGELCQPAPARIRRAMALTQWLISAKCWFMASLLTGGMTSPAPRAGQSSTSSDGADEASLRRPSQQASPAGTFGRLRPSEPPIAFDPRPRAALGPDAGQRAVAFQPGRNAPRGPGREALWNGAWRVHPETRFQPAGRQAPVGLRYAPARRSFFDSRVCLKAALARWQSPDCAAPSWPPPCAPPPPATAKYSDLGG